MAVPFSWVTFSGLVTGNVWTATSATAASFQPLPVAAADGSTKGMAAFTAADFNAAAGVISIDYTNGQAAAHGVKGYLTGTDWDTFNGKLSSVTGTNLDNVWSTTGILVRTGAATYSTITDSHSNWDAGYTYRLTSASGTAPLTLTLASNGLTGSVAVMGASGASHAAGLVPDPGAAAGGTKYLREDGTWNVPSGAGGGRVHLGAVCHHRQHGGAVGGTGADGNREPDRGDGQRGGQYGGAFHDAEH